MVVYGIKCGDCVVLFCGNCVEFMEVVFGCGWFGVVVVLINIVLCGL